MTPLSNTASTNTLLMRRKIWKNKKHNEKQNVSSLFLHFLIVLNIYIKLLFLFQVVNPIFILYFLL
jgi:hypothetical protein